MNSIGRQGNRDQLPRFVVQLVSEKGGSPTIHKLFGFELGFFFRLGGPCYCDSQKFRRF
jgi:hypothetical protein